MPVDPSYLAAFLVALLGGVHCVGMCGGIVAATTLGLPEQKRSRYRDLLPYLLAYNSGRIVSYTVAGALVGGLGSLAANLPTVYLVQRFLQGFAAAFLVLLGLYIAGWWSGLATVERAGGWLLWRHLQPLGRRLLPVSSPSRALQLGLLWGWLPCGLVYSVLIWTVSAGSATRGALLMLSFGLGTLPALLAMGTFAGALSDLVRRPLVRQLAGAAIIIFGIWMLAGAL